MILQEPIKSLSFVAFGVEPRLCLGMNLAKLEISLFVHFLMTKYR
jgi:cytochrome P450